MRLEIQKYLKSRQDLLWFVRENPHWYRQLGRDPKKIWEIEQAAKQYYGKTFPQKIDRFKQQIELANIFVHLMDTMGTNT